jgi:5-(carboxyamino)imidazole ribonucleotide mutase
MPEEQPLVGIIMGSDSDLAVMKDAAELLSEFGIPYEVTIVSAHRTPDRMAQYARTAAERGLKVIIAGAGGAAHLPGMTAAFSLVPVIGVPIESRSLKGLDSVLSIVQMPPGVPVATMAINGARNAALFAAHIIGAYDSVTQARLLAFRERMAAEVLTKAEKLETLGATEYLNKS